VNQGIALPLLYELLCVRKCLSPSFIVGRGKVNECLSEHAAHAGRLSLLRDGILEVIHIGESRDASANLFRRG